MELLQSLSDAASQSNHTRANLLLGDYFLKTEQYRQAVQPLLVALESLTKYPNADVTLRNRIALIVAYENLGMQEAATVHCLAIGATRRVPAGQNMRPLYSVIPTAELPDGSSPHSTAVRVAFTVDENGFVRDAVLVSGSNNETLSTVVFECHREISVCTPVCRRRSSCLTQSTICIQATKRGVTQR